MPIYEYRCNQCRRRVDIFVQSFSSPFTPKCPQCGSEDLTRLFSRFAMSKTDKDIYEDILSDSKLTRGLMENDPRALAEWNKRISRGMDEKVSPEYEEMLGRLEAGEPVQEVMQKAMETQKAMEIEGKEE